MKIKLKDNPSLNDLTIQDKANVEYLYITGCPLLNTWNILDSIRSTTGNILSNIRLSDINHTGFLSDLEYIKSNYGGLDLSGNTTENPYLSGTWIIPGIYAEDQGSLTTLAQSFGGNLTITPDAILLTFTDSEINRILNTSSWAFQYNSGQYGVSENTIIGITSIGQVFANNNTIGTFNEFENFTGVTTLSDGAFYDDSSLTSVKLPNSLVSVGNNVFSGCSSLGSIIYPENINYIGHNQITACNSLEYIRILKFAAIEEDSFDTYCPIYVGDGSSPWHDNLILSQILADSNWQAYKNRLDTWYNKIYKEKIPSDYEKLEYIESDGANIINTGKSFTNNTRFVADISFISNDTSIYGSEESGLVGIPNSGLFIYININGSDQPIQLITGSSWISDTETLYDINLKDKTINVNSINKYTGSGFITSKGGDITLFGNSTYKNIGRAYMTKIYENDTLVKDFVPVFKKSTGEIGLYEIIGETFYGFTTYSGYGIGTRLITEDFRKITTSDNKYIVVSNTNTNKIRVSKMDNGISYDNYYVPLSNVSEDKKYNLGILQSTSNNITNMVNISDFSDIITYTKGKFVYYGEKVYQFTENHYPGAWTGDDVIETSVYDKISEINGSNSLQNLNLILGSKSPTYIDYIKGTGTNYIQTYIQVRNSQLYRIEIKFKYEKWQKNGYIFGDCLKIDTLNTNQTFLRLGDDNNGSAQCCMATKNTESEVTTIQLTANTIHTVILKFGSIKVDNNAEVSLSTTQTNASANNYYGLLTLFSKDNSGSAISDIGLSVYYFKVYYDNFCLYDLRPCICCGKIGMIDPRFNKVYRAFGTGDFEIPDNITYPFSNKNIAVSFIDNTKIINNNTDNFGKCLTKFKRDQYYTITPQNINGYDYNPTIYKNTMLSDYRYCFMEKVTTNSYCTLTITVKVANQNIPTSFNLKPIYVFPYSGNYYNNTYIIRDTLTVFNNEETSSVNFIVYKNQTVLIIPPTISSEYTKPENQIITIENENTKQVDFIYTYDN